MEIYIDVLHVFAQMVRYLLLYLAAISIGAMALRVVRWTLKP